jgi:hypothetical protein
VPLSWNYCPYRLYERRKKEEEESMQCSKVAILLTIGEQRELNHPYGVRIYFVHYNSWFPGSDSQNKAAVDFSNQI